MKKKIFILTILLALAFLFLPPNSKIYSLVKVDEHNLDYDYKTPGQSEFYRYSELRSNLIANPSFPLNTALYGKKIMLETSDDLYNWSHDLSYFAGFSQSIKEDLVTRDYVLGQDIDYSEQKAKRFVPIGYYYFSKVDDITVLSELTFSGTFDGRGFEIKNLYFSVFNEYRFIEDNQTKVPSAFFSMFNYNNGEIRNLGLINPIIDLENEHPELRNFSYLVGENKEDGLVENVYVEDLRNDGGLRAKASQVTEENMKLAAGIIHTNEGEFRNSYFAGYRVVNTLYNTFYKSEPLVYTNNGTIEKVVYDQSIYVGTAATNGSGITTLKTASPLESNFKYYAADGYPKLYSLTKNGSNYEINGALDLIYFTKLISLQTIVAGSKSFNEESYILKGDIDFSDVANGAYKTPKTEFLGSFIGEVKIESGKEVYPQINNLVIDTAVIDGENVYYGLFSVFGGHFENIVFYNAEIKPNSKQIEDYKNYNFYLGFVAGVLEEAEIINVYIKGEIDLSGTNIGAFNVGSVAGEASGHIERVLFDESDINADVIKVGSQTYGSSSVKNNYQIGGIIGKTSETKKLTLYNALNKGNLSSVSGSRTTSQDVNVHFGGIIGGVVNTALIKHNIGFITNEGKLTAYQIDMSGGGKNVNYVGGVIGLSSGNSYDFSDVYGRWTNLGVFTYNDIDNGYVAGVLNSNHSESVEFTQIKNTNDLISNKGSVTVSALINHLSTNKLTISQAKSEGEIKYSGVQKQDVHGAIYTSSKNTELELNYVDVQTDLYVDYVNNTSHLNIAGITLNENANYLNVVYGGLLQVEVTNNNTSVVWISGITKQLSNNKVMKNSMNEGTIHAYIRTTNTTNSTVKNLYVGGLVNINESGDLHTQSDSMPRATKGIINSINQANMTSYFKSYKGIDGRINTFVGGIATINRGSIQDVVNTGDIRFANTTSGTQGQFVTIDGSESYAGRTSMYKTGVVIGGIVGVVTIGASRIYDSINSGNIIAQSYYYARSGGILGVVSPFDVAAGDVHNYTENNNAADPTHLKHSAISNGINYGNIYAITSVIGTYSTGNLGSSANLYQNTGSNYTWPSQVAPSINMQTRNGSSDRIAIHSAAGGIIGSGLSVLKRMINHGQIGATDAAGGIIGSVFVYSNQNWRSAGRGTTAVGVTIVNINTAINYGDIRAIRRHSGSSTTNNTYFNAIYNNTSNAVSEIQNSFFGYNDDFIIPTSPRNTAHTNSIRLFPEHKRGIGGIMGRIQRGGNQNMITNYDGVEFTYGTNLSSEEGSFDFIVNMNPNVDLIGRLDQNYNFSLSATAFHFHDAIYYSAKPNDTTQAVFTGFLINSGVTGYYVQGPNANVNRTGNGTRNNPYYYNVTGAQVTYQNAWYGETLLQKGQVSKVDTPSHLSYSQVYSNSSSFQINGGTSNWNVIDVPGGKFIVQTSSARTFGNAKPVPFITETPSANSEEYVYHEDFIMRDEETTLTTGESISKYIYYAAVDLLADKFQSTRPNGMYVLSTTAGSTFGSVLPRNFDINKLSKIKPLVPNNLNYENIDDEYLDFEDSNFIDLISIYKDDLYQTKLNDKSELFKEGQKVKIKDSEKNIELFYESAEFSGTDLIFSTNQSILGPTSGGGVSLNFKFLEAIISEGALIAREKAPSESWDDFQALLEQFRAHNPTAIVATGDLAPNLSRTFTSYAGTGSSIDTYIGDFIIYSEAAILDKSFTSFYNTKYELKLQIGGTVSNPSLLQTKFDNGNFGNHGTSSQDNRYEIENSIGLLFSDTSGMLPTGYVIDSFLNLYYTEDGNNVLVDKAFYDIVSTPKSGTTFETHIYLGDLLRAGKYEIGYIYHANDNIDKTIFITFDPDREFDFIEFKPYTSTFYDGDIADVRFDYDLFNIHNNHASTGRVVRTIDPNKKPYEANYYIYEVDFLESFKMTDFFEFDNVMYNYSYNDYGYIEYEVDFRIGSEVIVQKTIIERALSPIYYKNNISLPTTDVVNEKIKKAITTASRDADSTIFTLDYKLDEEFYDNPSNFVITYKFDNGPEVPITTSSDNLYYNIDGRLYITLTKEALPGTYEIFVNYSRADKTILAGIIEVEKLLGQRGYLENIKFAKDVIGAEYPNIFVTDSTNTVIKKFKPSTDEYGLNVYYAGIDYDDADINGENYFRIDGEVARIPLNNYMPFDIIDFLPPGAMIQRKYYEDGIAKWSELVGLATILEYGEELGEEKISYSLSTDFTGGELVYDPEIGEFVLKPIYIEYRVIPESDLDLEEPINAITYFISVVDVDYTFLAVVGIYYKEGNEVDGYTYTLIDDIAQFDKSMLFLNVFNYTVAKDGVELEVGDSKVEITDFHNIEFDEITNIESKASMFYYVDNENRGQYVYQLGSNLSGFYQFNFILPEDYTYEIYYKNLPVEGEENIKLPEFSSYIEDMPGYFYYINASPVTRTEYFYIVVEAGSTTNKEWGFVDNQTTWDETLND